MARTEARIYTSIWGDPDVLQRSILAQWVYFATLSHPQLSHCGVVGYAPGRYTRLASRLVPGGKPVNTRTVEQAFEELEETRFVQIDRDTAEVWVRALVKRDGVLRQPNVVKAMMREFSAILSVAIRRGFVEALGEGFLEGLAEGFPKVFPQPFAKVIPEPFLKAYLEGFPEPPTCAGGGGRGGAGAPPPPPFPPPPPTPGGNPSAPGATNGHAIIGNSDGDRSNLQPPPGEEPEADEHPKLRPLAEHFAGALWPGRQRRLSESVDVVRRCLAVADPSIVDECIGAAITAGDAPQHPNYLAAAVRNRLVSMGAYAADDEALAPLGGRS